MHALVLSLVLLAAPDQTHFWMELEGVPVGQVTLRREGDTYLYRSVHLFPKKGSEVRRRREETQALDAQGRGPSGLVPEGLWLWTRPALGCVEGREELTDRRGPLCADRQEGARTTGTILGEPFDALYDASDRLSSLHLGAARFRRQEGSLPALPPGAEPSLPLPPGPGALCLRPPHPSTPGELRPMAESAARRLARELGRGGPDEGCLERAREFRRRADLLGADAAVTHGLWVHEGRAWPHAWVQVRTPEGALLVLDPANDPAPAPAKLLPLAIERGPAGAQALEAGHAWLSLWRGERRLAHCPGRP